MDKKIQVSHQRIPVNKSFESFIGSLETVVRPLDPSWSKTVIDDPEGVVAELNKIAAETGLMIFGTQPHGDLLHLLGLPRKKAKQYLIGNPLTAIRMTKHDMRAALYAPLRILVLEDTDGKTYVEYDLPSTLFGQFGNAEVTKVALELDEKLLNAIKLSDV